MGIWDSFAWATSIMVHFSKSIASEVVRLPLMGFRRRKNDMQHRRRRIVDTGMAPLAASNPCNSSDARTQPLAAAVARAEASWLLKDLQHALNTMDEVAMSRVGNMLMAGYGSKQDPEEAALWMREAWALQNFYEFELGSPDAHGVLCSKPCAATAAPSPKHSTSYVGELHHQHQQERGQLQYAHAISRSQDANPQGTSQCASTEGGCHRLPKDSQAAGQQPSAQGSSSSSIHPQKDSQAAGHQASSQGISSSSSHSPKGSQDTGQSASIKEGSCHSPQRGCSSRGSTSRGSSPPANHLQAHSSSSLPQHCEVHEHQGTSTVTYGGVQGEALGGGEGSGRWGLQGSSEPSTDDFSTDEEWAENSARSLQGSLGSLARGFPAGQLLGAGAFLCCAFKAAQGGSGSCREDEQQSLRESESSKQCEGGCVVGKGCCDTEEAEVGFTGCCSGDQRIVSRRSAAEWPRACLFRTPMSGKRRRMSL